MTPQHQDNFILFFDIKGYSDFDENLKNYFYEEVVKKIFLKGDFEYIAINTWGML